MSLATGDAVEIVEGDQSKNRQMKCCCQIGCLSREECGGFA